MIQTFKGENADIASGRECCFTNLQLNQDVPEETFSYTNLGLEEGDMFSDKIKNKEYRYEVATKQLKPVEK